MIRDREAVVLAGGFGTRLAHVVGDVPKPMAPVAGRPFLRYVLDQLAEAGFARAVVADGYKRECIEGYFGDSYRGMEVAYSPEDTPLGTGGAVKRALALCRNEWVFVLNGDTYLDAGFGALEEAAEGAGPGVGAVLAVKEMRDFDRYGTLDVAPDGTVASFHEKRSCRRGLVNAGVYLVRRGALAGCPDAFSLESGYFERVVGSGALAAARCDGMFIDIGVPDDYGRAQGLLAPLARRWRLAMFDRDGTVNVDTGHLHDPADLALVPGTVELLRECSSDPGCKVAVVTNQAGIAKGLYTEGDMHALHRALDERLAGLGCRVDAYYFCPHHPDFTGPCGCRKPAPGMLLRAMREFDADPAGCVFYGDSETDMQAARAAHVRGVLVSADAKET